MGEEKSRDITGITVRYSDGSTKEIQSGCCVDLEKGSDDLSVEMLNVKPFDLVRLTYGGMAVETCSRNRVAGTAIRNSAWADWIRERFMRVV